MDHRWFRGVPDSEKEERKEQIKRYANAFDELDLLLEQIEESISLSPNYDQPGWAAKMAEQVGRKKAFDEIRRIIKILED